MLDTWGREQAVMHACGHDMHMACLMAASKLMLQARSCWNGTLIVVFQPDEEHTGGARAMVDGGLYDRVPIPDVVLAQHAMAIKSGMVSVRDGPVLVSADTMNIRMFASVGYRVNPQLTVNAVVVASKIVVRLEGLAAQISGEEYASVEVEEIHAGEPGLDYVDHVDLVLDVKTYGPDVRNRLLAAITELVKAECLSSGAKRPPEITTTVRAPLTDNHVEVTSALAGAFRDFFGDSMVSEETPSHPCEDFSILATSKNVPYAFWFLGRVDPVAFDKAKRDGNFSDSIANEHSAFNAPVIQPTLKTGTDALSLAALTFLTK